MADWKTVMTMVVRTLINDPLSTMYSDERIQTAIVVAGLIASQEIDLGTEYSFDLSVSDITPDPVATNDTLAVALFALKAACILNINSYQTAVGRGIKVRDGDSEVDTTGSFKGFKDILDIGPCGAYTKLLKSAYITQGFGKGKAVFGPVATTGYGPNGIWHVRGLYDSFMW